MSKPDEDIIRAIDGEGLWQAPPGGCTARLGDRRCARPRQNKSHWEQELEWHSDGEGSWDDDAPGAEPHPKSKEIASLHKIIRDHARWHREARDELAALRAVGEGR